MDRILLVRHGTTRDTRAGRFPVTCGNVAVDGCEPLDRRGCEDAAALRDHVPAADRVWSSLATRTRQTAELAGFRPDERAELAECDFGSWAGKEPRAVHAEDAEGLAAWYADPDVPPHGGEGLGALRGRARAVLDEAGALGGTTLAFTHGGFVRAALMEALGWPVSVFWNVDVAPASVTELHLHAGGSARLVCCSWTPQLSRAMAVRR